MANVQQTFLNMIAGVLTQVKSTILGGAGNENKVVQTDGNGTLDPSLFPAGLGPELVLASASEALVAGAFVQLYSNAGTLNVRNADASVAGKEANGFVVSGFAQNATATVYSPGLGKNGQVTGQTVGPVYLSATTPGGTQSTPPSGAGQVVQQLGIAVSAANIDVNIRQPVQLA